MKSMKIQLKIRLVLLLLLAAGSISLFAQRGMRGMGRDSTRMGRMHMHRMMPDQDSTKSGRMDHGMGRLRMPVMPPFMDPMWRFHRSYQYGSWPWMYRWMPGHGMWHHGITRDFGWRQGPGMLDRIPNLTDKQKKEISDLRQKHRDEMENLRTDMQKRMKEMRDSHRKAIMNILTDEQKKWFEENTPESKEQPLTPEPPEVPSTPKPPVM